MPIYEYKCPECESLFEHLASLTDKKPPKCPECGSANTHKQLSTFNTGEKSSDFSSCPTGTCSLK